MGRVHEGVHGPGPYGWSMELGSIFCLRPFYQYRNFTLTFTNANIRPKNSCFGLIRPEVSFNESLELSLYW